MVDRPCRLSSATNPPPSWSFPSNVGFPRAIQGRGPSLGWSHGGFVNYQRRLPYSILPGEYGTMGRLDLTVPPYEFPAVWQMLW